MALKDVSLGDKYDLTKSQVFITGTQAVIRLMLMQKARDRAAGLNTGGYISGYRGSPLGGLDQQFARASKLLADNDIVFETGLNEDLAATAIWGTQQAEMRGEGKYDGVFSIWYGKGPGVDRTGDVFRHANFAGTSPNGGVLALMGDDHTCESSTTAHQSEFAFVDAMIPILNPAGVQEIFDFGLLGWAMSRYTGCWVGLKCVKDTVESTASINGALDRLSIITPDDFEMPPDGLNIRPGDVPLAMEARLHDYKRFAVAAFARANGLDKTIFRGGSSPRIGIATTGKSYLDVRQALDSLGIDEVRAADLGIKLLKVAMPWPLEPSGIERFADGLDLIIVVEEKRSLIETQIKEILYGRANAPVVIGKKDERGQTLFQSKAALDANDVAVAIGERVFRFTEDEPIAQATSAIKQFQERLSQQVSIGERIPYFCAGCPHNSSTHVPEGSRAYAGIGCHYMAQWMERDTEGYTHMGGEGANWVGEHHFSTRDHVFQNLGDGTYNHSGSMAIRAAAGSGANITYKILYNDAVAMTGGQTHDGGLSVFDIARQVVAEGARQLAIVTDEPEKYENAPPFPPGTTVHHRDTLDDVQRTLRDVKGLSVLIYDQTCAAEKRRRRKRGTFPDPDKRIVINEMVCEGCGDCGVQSNCVAIQPVETEFGRKRQIDQSSCNKDFTCVKGFCPSFVTVHGGKLKKGSGASEGVGDEIALVDPPMKDLDRPFNLVITGVGGTGVVTIGAIIGMAAHLDGKGCGIIDMAGLAQKGGSVVSHLKIANAPEDISTIRVGAGQADCVIGGDLVVAGSQKVLGTMREGQTTVIANLAETYPGAFTRDADFSLPSRRIVRAIEKEVGDENARFVDASALATNLLGNAIAANMLILGYAYQRGGIPLSLEAIEKAIALNGVAVEQNLKAFNWGRKAAIAPDDVAKWAQPNEAKLPWQEKSETLDEIIDRRIGFLTAYQSKRYAKRYRLAVERVRKVEDAKTPGETRLTETVARYLFKLMAVKDEYEVARLYTNGDFKKQLERTFEPGFKLEFHLAPPVGAPRDPKTGQLQKRSFGPWMMSAFGILARLKALRGTPLDIFGYTAERKSERALIKDYLAMLDTIADGLTLETHAIAIGLAGFPEKVRGYGHVRERHVKTALTDRDALLEAFKAGGFQPQAEAAE
ncbi:MAG: indolepyruvate ferredoxin oxidoreductase family protein [Pseudomonadota bacterium]